MPDEELDPWETVMIEVGDTVTWLVTVDVMGTWLIESPSLPVGAAPVSLVGETEDVNRVEGLASVDDTSVREVAAPVSLAGEAGLEDKVEAPASVEDVSDGKALPGPAVSAVWLTVTPVYADSGVEGEPADEALRVSPWVAEPEVAPATTSEPARVVVLGRRRPVDTEERSDVPAGAARLLVGEGGRMEFVLDELPAAPEAAVTSVVEEEVRVTGQTVVETGTIIVLTGQSLMPGLQA
jgi:hypothetical protein